MAETKSKQKPSRSPKGTLRYPWLTNPDKKFNDRGVFKTNLVMDADEAEPLLDKLNPQIDAAFKQAKKDAKNATARKAIRRKTPWVENDDGTIEFKFSTYASGETKKGKKWKKDRLALFDAAGKPITENINIGEGTVALVAFTVSPYYMAANDAAGVKLYLEAVQIIELVEYTGKSAESFGFDEEEGFSKDDLDDSPFGGDDEDKDDDLDEDEDGEDEDGEDEDADEGGPSENDDF